MNIKPLEERIAELIKNADCTTCDMSNPKACKTCMKEATIRYRGNWIPKEAQK